MRRELLGIRRARAILVEPIVARLLRIGGGINLRHAMVVGAHRGESAAAGHRGRDHPLAVGGQRRDPRAPSRSRANEVAPRSASTAAVPARRAVAPTDSRTRARATQARAARRFAREFPYKVRSAAAAVPRPRRHDVQLTVERTPQRVNRRRLPRPRVPFIHVRTTPTDLGDHERSHRRVARRRCPARVERARAIRGTAAEELCRSLRGADSALGKLRGWSSLGLLRGCRDRPARRDLGDRSLRREQLRGIADRARESRRSRDRQARAELRRRAVRACRTACTSIATATSGSPTRRRSKDGKGQQVFKFSPDGKLLMTLGKAGVAGRRSRHLQRPVATSSSRRTATSSSPTAIIGRRARIVTAS